MISCEDRLRNDLYCVERGVKLYSTNRPTCFLFAREVVLDATRRVLPAVAAVADASLVGVARVAVGPVSVRRRTVVVPRRRVPVRVVARLRGDLVQTEPVVLRVQQRAAFTSHIVST